jgi:zinc protease
MHFPELAISTEEFSLDNGLKLLVHEDHKTPIVAVNIWYHVGSKNEKPGKTGFAHLFEHLMFGGSEHLPGSYIEALERIGATDLNGTTNEDRTNYFENVPTPALDFALFAESDRMGHFYSTIGQQVLDLQRGVVQNEKRQGDNQPYAIVEELLVKATYPASHPYAHTVIGSMEDLDSATLEDVREWFKTYYTPSNAVLVLAGDIDAVKARELVERYFGDIPPGPPIAHQRSWIAKMTGEHRETAEDRVPQARVYKAWNVPGFGCTDLHRLRLAAGILAYGKTSRLYKRLVYDEQIATQVAAYLDEREIGSQFVVIATAREGVPLVRVERAVNEELGRFLQQGPEAHELERIQTAGYANFVRGLERIGGFGGKSDVLASSQTFTGGPHAYRKRLQDLTSATKEDVCQAFRNWVSDGVYTLEVLPFLATKPARSSTGRSAAPGVGAAENVRLPLLQEDTLSNGLKLLVAERHEIPVVNFWLEVDAGYASDQFARPGAARLACALLTGGTKRRSALDISDEAQSIGAQLSAGCNLDISSVYLSALKQTLEEALDLYADVILNPIFPEADFERQRTLQLAAIANERVTPMQMALRALPPILFGPDHAYGVPFTGSGSEDSIGKLTRGDMAALHQTWFRPGNATLIVVGDTTLDEIKPKLEQLFAGWGNRRTPAKNLRSVARPPRPVIYLVNKPGAKQSVVIAGTVVPPPDATTEPEIETMNNIFGGSFGSRLNMNLREEKHWCYGAASVLYSARAQRPLLAYTSVQADKTAESMAEILEELRGMSGAKPISNDELEKVKRQQILELPGSLETMNSMGNLFANLLQLGLPLNYYDSYIERVKGITAADIERCAKTLLDPAHVILMAVGDAAEIEAPLQRLGIAEIVPAEV